MSDGWYSSIFNSEGKIVLTPIDVVDLVAQYIEECIESHERIAGYIPDGYYGDDEFDREKFKKSFREWLGKR